jgi:hypothetical protein
MVKKKEKGLSRDVILGVVVAVLGAVAGTFTTLIFAPPDLISQERNEILLRQTSELNRQASALEGGFDKLSNALVQNKQTDPQLLAVLDGLTKEVGGLTKSSDEIAKNLRGTITYDPGTFIVLLNETEEIDDANQVSIRSASANTNRINVTVNGRKMYMEPGARIPYASSEGKDCYIVFIKRLSDNSFQFLKRCQ